MDRLTPEERRLALTQAIANNCIEGVEPTPGFLADCVAVIAGNMSSEKMRARIIAHARAVEARAAGTDSSTTNDAGGLSGAPPTSGLVQAETVGQRRVLDAARVARRPTE